MVSPDIIDPLTAREIIRRERIQQSSGNKDFDREAAFKKLAFWLREFGNDDEMAQFIEKIALKKNFARDYQVNTRLLKMLVKLFKAAETLYKPFETENNTITEYTNRYKALQKETTSIRTLINRLTDTIYRGTQRKPDGGTRSESRGSPDCCKDQT